MLPSVCFNWKGFTSAHLVEFQKELNSAVLKDMRSNKDNISVTVLAVDITRKESEYKWRLKFIIKWKKQKTRVCEDKHKCRCVLWSRSWTLLDSNIQ